MGSLSEVDTSQHIFTTGSACTYTLQTLSIAEHWRDDSSSGEAHTPEQAEHTIELKGAYPGERPTLRVFPSSTMIERYPEICELFALKAGEPFPLPTQTQEVEFECTSADSNDYAILQVNAVDSQGEPSEMSVWVHNDQGDRSYRIGDDHFATTAAFDSCLKECDGFATRGCGC